MKRKIAITTGTRADYGYLRPILKAISQSKTLSSYLIVTGMHLSKKHGMSINEIRKDGFKIYTKIDMMPKGDVNYFMSEALGKGIVSFSKVFRKLRPDLNIVFGDRDEQLASALAAYHMNIPNAHIHGGDKSGGLDEYNRHAITKISNVHFSGTKNSKKRIIKMGEKPNFVFFTGSTTIDEIVDNKITSKKNLEKKYKLKLKGDEILLVQHPVTTETAKSEKQIVNTLKAIVKLKKLTFAIAPNNDAGNRKIFQQLKLYSQKYNFIKMFRNLPRCDYLGMLKNCGVLVGNSSSGLIEGSYFDIPVINIGIRQANRERGTNVQDVKNNSVILIHRAIEKALKKKPMKFNNKIFGNGKASFKIVRIIERLKLDQNLIQKQITY